MKKLTLKGIEKLQKEYGFDKIQNNINSGLVWKLEGSFGRQAMALIESGACMLPLTPRFDAYFNVVPSRDMVKKGTKGTFQYSVDFWQGVLDGKIEIDEFLDVEDMD